MDIAWTSERYAQLLIEASARGALRLVRQLVEEQGCPITADDHMALILAVSNGRLPVVRYLVERAPAFVQQPVDLAAQQNMAVIEAASNGHHKIIRYLVETAPHHADSRVDITDCDNAALRAAVARGRLMVVRYLLDEAPRHGQARIDLAPYLDRLLTATVVSGNGRLLGYLVEKAAQCGQRIPADAVRTAAYMGRLDLVRCLLDKAPEAVRYRGNIRQWFDPGDRFTSYGVQFREIIGYLVDRLPYRTGQVLELSLRDTDSQSAIPCLAEKLPLIARQRALQQAGVCHTDWRALLQLPAGESGDGTFAGMRL